MDTFRKWLANEEAIGPPPSGITPLENPGNSAGAFPTYGGGKPPTGQKKVPLLQKPRRRITGRLDGIPVI